MTMRREPLLDCSMRQVDQAKSETWTLTLAHYEEQIPLLEWLHACAPHLNTGPIILHRHTPEVADCNDQCHLIWWENQTLTGKPITPTPAEIEAGKQLMGDYGSRSDTP